MFAKLKAKNTNKFRNILCETISRNFNKWAWIKRDIGIIGVEQSIFPKRKCLRNIAPYDFQTRIQCVPKNWNRYRWKFRKKIDKMKDISLPVRGDPWAKHFPEGKMLAKDGSIWFPNTYPMCSKKLEQM